ncbi:S1C family serine protease [Porticoccaceae bacterium]|nr:S1C family serine protease [Porticoccaceae bacterium]
MKNIYKKIMLPLMVIMSFQAHAARIDGYQKLEDGDYQFSRFIQSIAGSKFYLSFTSQTSEDATLILESDGKTTDLARFSLEPGTAYKFPSDEKSITLTEPGSYTFILRTSNPGTYDSLTIVIDQPKKLFSLRDATDSQSVSPSAAVTSGPSAFNYDIAQYSLTTADVKPVAVATSTRSAGSKIYKKYSSSVPLIESGNSLGSGVFIKSDLILTNKHVVGDASKVRVAIKPSGFGKVKNARRYEGTVIKFDDNKDLALVKLNIVMKDIPTVKLAKDKDVEVAMQVHAIGHPLSEYWSYTLGYISQFRPKYSWLKYSADVIQTQTPINPGNSGGPLLNNEGLLVGINSFGNPESPGMNYAVAYTSVKEFLDSRDSVVAQKKVKPKEKEPKCESSKLSSGKPYIRCDHDHNGVADRYTIDARDSGGYLEIWFDNNENKIFELMLRIVPIDGQDDIWVFNIDADEIGEWTQVGADYDRDWNVDEWL